MSEDVVSLDVDGIVDSLGITLIGTTTKTQDGKWRCLANVSGCLCIVEVKITFEQDMERS